MDQVFLKTREIGRGKEGDRRESVYMVIRFEEILYNERFHILLYKKLIKVFVL